MRITCPHCQTTYEVASADPDIHFLCARCNNEFFIDKPEENDALISQSPPNPDIQLGLFKNENSNQSLTRFHLYKTDSLPRPPFNQGNKNTAESILSSEPGEKGNENALSESINPDIHDLEKSDQDQQVELDEIAPAPGPPESAQKLPIDETPELPNRRVPRFLTWLSWVMLAIAIAGFTYNHTSWSENLWFRSLLLNLHFPMAIRPSDWSIPPKSVHAEWIRRDNGSSVLVIEGKVVNRLHVELSTPWIQVTVYDALHSKKTLKRETMAITLPPKVEAIEHTPWKAPPKDKVPVAAAGSRGFVLVIDNLPKQAGEFTLEVIPSLS